MIVIHFNRTITIGDYIVSDTSSAFVIAEAGVNHNGDMQIAKQLIDIAVDAGAHAVKFQTFKAEHLILRKDFSVAFISKSKKSK